MYYCIYFLKGGMRLMKDNKDTKLFIITIILLVLSYIIPLVGVLFSIFILVHSQMRKYNKWVTILSINAIVYQIPFILGWLTWITN